MNEYLSKLKNTNLKTVEDVVRFNDENPGSQGANPGDHPAFPSGQVIRSNPSATPLLLLLTTILGQLPRSSGSKRHQVSSLLLSPRTHAETMP